jgi:hypothetical protein
LVVTGVPEKNQSKPLPLLTNQVLRQLRNVARYASSFIKSQPIGDLSFASISVAVHIGDGLSVFLEAAAIASTVQGGGKRLIHLLEQCDWAKGSPGRWGRAHRGFGFPFAGGNQWWGGKPSTNFIVTPGCVFSARLTVYCAVSCCRPSHAMLVQFSNRQISRV